VSTHRRRSQLSAGAMVLVGMLLLAACDWTQFGYGAAHTGFNPTETAISPANVSALVPFWSGATGGIVGSPPAVANGVAYVGSYDKKLYAFDAAGATHCSTTPTTCSPLWTAATGGAIFSSPAVANGVVYTGSADGRLYAFDAAGATRCSGSPKICAPLWTASLGTDIEASPTVANGIVYISSDEDKVFALDAAGVTGCSDTPGSIAPKTCTPLWSARSAGGMHATPAVANGVLYVGTIWGELDAFDAAGATGCSGTPRTCMPLWTDLGMRGGVGFYSDFKAPVVANGVVYAGSFTPNDWGLYAFDAAGAIGCSGVPKTCVPLWKAAPGAVVLSSVAVANGVVYLAGVHAGYLYALDAAGCGPFYGQECQPLWTGALPFIGAVEAPPAVANGVVYVVTFDGFLNAFDVAGCGQPSALRCDPLWTVFVGDHSVSSPAVANGVVYVGSYDRSLHTYHLP